MKKLLIIAVCLFFIQITKSKAQVTDTLLYLQKIVARKNDFIGKPFSVLENNLLLRIKFFTINSNITYDITKETSTIFSFINPITDEDFSFPSLWVFWNLPLDAKKSRMLWDKTDGGGWTQEVDSLYSKAIIKDIMILP